MSIHTTSETGVHANDSLVDQPRSGRHPVEIGHLVMGVAFLTFVLIWALIIGGTLAVSDLRFLLPLPWVLAGVAGLIALAVSSRRRKEAEADARARARTEALAAEEESRILHERWAAAQSDAQPDHRPDAPAYTRSEPTTIDETAPITAPIAADKDDL